MFKFVKDLWMIHTEAAKARKAARLLIKQEWAMEFLVLLMAKAVACKKLGVRIVLKNHTGQELHLVADAPEVKKKAEETAEADVLTGNVTLETMLERAWAAGMMN